MTDLTPVSALSPVPQLETNTIALAGPGNPMNAQAQALLNRTEFLGNSLASFAADVSDSTSLSKGAGLVGFNSALSYPPGTAGSAIGIALSGLVDIRSYGGIGDGVTDNSPALALARAAASGRFVYIPAGNWKFNSVSSSSDDLKIAGDGSSTVLDFSGSITGGNYALEATGSATLIEGLSGTQNAGANSVLFSSAPSLDVGDVFVIFNSTASSWSGFRAYYFAGEWCEVESISGNTVTTKNPLYDTYVAASVDVYRISGPDVDLRDFKVVGTTITGLIHPEFCIRPLLENITGEHANDSVVYFDRCYKGVFNNPSIRNVGDGGDDYGIAIGNSQHTRINGGDVYGRRHAITNGGGTGICSVPVRDSRISGALLRNDIASGTEAADFHGNTEDSSYVNCTIYGGANLQGKDNYYDGCTITSTNTGYVIYHAEVKGGRLGAQNCIFKSYTNPHPAGRGLYDIGGNSPAITASTVLPCVFFSENNRVYGRNLSSSTAFMRFNNAGSTQKINFEICGLSGDVNAIGSILVSSLTSGSANSDRIIVDEIAGFPNGTILHNASGGSYLSFPHRAQRQTGQLTLTATSGTAATIAAIQTFWYAYPRTPSGFATSVGGIVGNRHALAELNALTATTIRPQIVTGDQTNWSATSDRVVSWLAELAEV